MERRTREIQLGQHTYAVVAQRHAYLERQLGPQLGEALQLAGGDASTLIRSGSEGYHKILSIFIPELMPLWEWRGFSSQTAYDEDLYDQEADNSPDLDQMVEAFKAVTEVNRIDMVGKLKDLVGPDFFASDLWRALRARGEVEALKVLTDLGDGDSGSSQLPNGESPQTNGGTPAQTPASSGDGPIPASSTT